MVCCPNPSNEKLTKVRNATRQTDKEGSRKLFLTMLGTGAYGNDPRWLWEIFRHLCTKYATTHLEIYVVNYSDDFPQNLSDGIRAMLSPAVSSFPVFAFSRLSLWNPKFAIGSVDARRCVR